MRTFCSLILAGLALSLGSCGTSADKHRGGGGAFDDSYMGRRLDSNNPDLESNQTEDGKPAAPSYSQWRHD